VFPGLVRYACPFENVIFDAMRPALETEREIGRKCRVCAHPRRMYLCFPLIWFVWPSKTRGMSPLPRHVCGPSYPSNILASNRFCRSYIGLFVRYKWDPAPESITHPTPSPHCPLHPALPHGWLVSHWKKRWGIRRYSYVGKELSLEFPGPPLPVGLASFFF